MDLLDQVLKDKDESNYKHSLQVWSSMLPAFSMGGKPPEAPPPPKWFPKKLDEDGIDEETIALLAAGKPLVEPLIDPETPGKRTWQRVK